MPTLHKGVPAAREMAPARNVATLIGRFPRYTPPSGQYERGQVNGIFACDNNNNDGLLVSPILFALLLGP